MAPDWNDLGITGQVEPGALATGYLDAGTETQLRQFGHALSIAKPFSMQQLNGMLNRLATPESA